MAAPPKLRGIVMSGAWLVLALALLSGCGAGGGSTSSGSAGGGSGGSGSGASGQSGGGGHSSSAATPPKQVAALIPAPGAPPHSVRVPVLTYHRVAPATAAGLPDLKVDPANFVAQLRALYHSGYHTITQARLFGALYHHGSLPPKPIIISVDDGYVDDITRILPALQHFHMVATFFVITGRMSEPGFLTAAQIRQLDREGMDVGDHTAHHVDLRLLSPTALRTETAGSRKVLQRVLGHPVYFFAYPFGAHNPTVDASVHAAGFTMAYTTAGGITETTTAPLAMPRVHVGAAETPHGLLALLGSA